MNPQHHDPSTAHANRKASAPYNFVPLPEKVLTISEPLPRHDQYDAELLTGTLTSTLTTASPLYVRAYRTLDKGPDGKPIQPTDSAYGEQKEDLIIPGSSLRGMLRTLVEVVSYSRLAPVTDKRLFFRTVDDTSVGISFRERMLPDKVRAGFFHQTDQEAWITPTLAGRVSRKLLQEKLEINSMYREVKGPRRIPLPNVQHRQVYIQLDDKAASNPAHFYEVAAFEVKSNVGLQEAMLVITGDMQNKEREFVFVRHNTNERVKVPDKLLQDFQDDDQITPYQRNAFPSQAGRKRDGWPKDGEPVFYLPDEDGKEAVAFGRAYMFRLQYLYSPEEMIPLRANPVEGLDLAEALFGRVDTPGNQRGTIAGRVYITDARLNPNGTDPIMPAEVISTQALSTPSPTSIQHYLTQRYPDLSEHLDHYDHDPNTEAALRGHKFYWHKGGQEVVERVLAEAMKPRKINGQEDPKDRNEFKPVKSDQQFTFTIHFENLRPEELGALLWVLDVANDPKYRLKIGMGKPYGLGSVGIKASPQLSDRKLRYAKLFSGDNAWNEGIMCAEKQTERLKEARDAFDDFVLDDKDVNPTGAQRIAELPRIRELLAMLTWEGCLDPEKTGYMHLDAFSGKKKGSETNPHGLDKRPVLPKPTTVLSGRLPDTSPQPPPAEPAGREPDGGTIQDIFAVWRQRDQEAQEDNDD